MALRANPARGDRALAEQQEREERQRCREPDGRGRSQGWRFTRLGPYANDYVRAVLRKRQARAVLDH